MFIFLLLVLLSAQIASSSANAFTIRLGGEGGEFLLDHQEQQQPPTVREFIGEIRKQVDLLQDDNVALNERLASSSSSFTRNRGEEGEGRRESYRQYAPHFGAPKPRQTKEKEKDYNGIYGKGSGPKWKSGYKAVKRKVAWVCRNIRKFFGSVNCKSLLKLGGSLGGGKVGREAGRFLGGKLGNALFGVDKAGSLVGGALGTAVLGPVGGVVGAVAGGAGMYLVSRGGKYLANTVRKHGQKKQLPGQRNFKGWKHFGKRNWRGFKENRLKKLRKAKNIGKFLVASPMAGIANAAGDYAGRIGGAAAFGAIGLPPGLGNSLGGFVASGVGELAAELAGEAVGSRAGKLVGAGLKGGWRGAKWGAKGGWKGVKAGGRKFNNKFLTRRAPNPPLHGARNGLG